MAPTRVAMFVLNSCESDARVRRAADALGRSGYAVRIFAVADKSNPPGLVQLDTFSIHRLAVGSLPQALVRRQRRRSRATRQPERGLTPQNVEPIARSSVARRMAWALRRIALPLHRTQVTLAYQLVASAHARAWRPEILHAHDLNTMPAAHRLARRLGAALVYDSHELWRHRNRHGEHRPVGRLTDRLVETRLIRDVDAVLTVSPSIAAWLARTYRLEAPVTVVRNIPAGGTRPTSSLRDLAGVRDGHILLYTGRIASSRGLETAIAGLARLPPDLTLVLLGYGDRPYLARLLAQARRQGVADRVRLVAPVPHDQVTGVASEADAALVGVEPSCLSYRYSLPNKLFEAIHAGIPVVATELPDIDDIVQRFGLGATFRPGDVQSLAAAVRLVLDGGRQYRRNAATAALELTWQREAQQLLGVYERLGR